MIVTFSTGEKRLLDTTLLSGSAFKPLADEKIFNNPVIFHGVITWNNGKIDIAPETVYRNSYAYDSVLIWCCFTDRVNNWNSNPGYPPENELNKITTAGN